MSLCDEDRSSHICRLIESLTFRVIVLPPPESGDRGVVIDSSLAGNSFSGLCLAARDRRGTGRRDPLPALYIGIYIAKA